MKHSRKSITLVFIAAALVASTAMAVPTTVPLPSLAPAQQGLAPVAGQSTLVSQNTGGDVITVDWMVIPCSFGGFGASLGCVSSTDFAYLYQIENDTSTANAQGLLADLIAFSVSYDNLGGTDAYIVGYLPNFDDLDVANGFHPAHTVAGESEPGGAIVNLDNPGAFGGNTSTTSAWNWFAALTTIPAGDQGSTLFMLSTRPPVYGNANAQDGTPPSPWASTNGGQRVPVPGVPEPATLALLGLGLLALGATKRRASRK